MNSITLVGIGKLGGALMKQWDQHNVQVGVHHLNETKLENFLSAYKTGHTTTKENLNQMKAVIMAIPADQINDFISEHLFPNTYFINMATAANTLKLREQFPSLQICSMKFIGHANDLLNNGNGLFITEPDTPEFIRDYFKTIGTVKTGDPEVVGYINREATYFGIKAAVELEEKLKENNIEDEYIEKSMTSITPEVIKSYNKGELGHFGQSIANEIKGKNH